MQGRGLRKQSLAHFICLKCFPRRPEHWLPTFSTHVCGQSTHPAPNPELNAGLVCVPTTHNGMQWNHTLGVRLLMCQTRFRWHQVILLQRGHISLWSKMMHKALVQHSFPMARIHLLSSTVQGDGSTGWAVGWLREAECAGRLYEAAQVEMESHSSHYAFL